MCHKACYREDVEIVPGNVKEPTAVAGTVELLLKKQLYSKLLFPDS